MKKIILTLVLTLLLPFQVLALDIVAAPYGYITDQADIFSDEFQAELESTLTTLEEETTAEIGILTINSLEDEYIEGYAVETFRAWGIGQAGADNGVLLLIAVEDREMRIEVGYGLEGAITDAESSFIINYTLVPYFQEGNYETGVETAVEQLSALIHGEAITEGFDYNESHYDSVDAAFDEWYEEELTIYSIAISMIAGITVFAVLMASLGIFEKKERRRLVKYPIPLIIMATIALFANINWVGWVLCLGLGLFIQLFLVIFAYARPGKGGGSGFTGCGWSGSSSSSNSGSSFGSSSGGQSFGGGSSGGGGASGKW